MNDLLIRWGNRAIGTLVLAAVSWGVFIHSAFPAISATVLFSLLGLAVCIWAGLRLFAQDASSVRSRNSRVSRPAPPFGPQSLWIWGPISLLGLLVILQMIPLPAPLVGALSPRRAELAQRLSEGLPELKSSSLAFSVDPNTSLRALPFFVFPVMAFLLGGFLASSPRRARGIVRILLCLVLAEALYGLAEQLTGHRHVLWIPDNGWDAQGTFVNRNHFAATLSLFLPVAIGWLYFRISDHISDPDPDRESLLPPTFWDILNSRHSLWLFAPAVLVLGIIQGHSRGGFSSMVFGLAFMLWAGLRSRMVRAFAVVGILLGLAILGSAITSDYRVVFNRFGEPGDYEGEAGRMATWRNSLGIVSDYPWFGIGLGNFADVYPRYEKGDYGWRPLQAHDEWLEGLLTFGFLGMCPLVIALVVCFVKSCRVIRHAGRDKPWLLGVWCGLLGLVLHSFVEFTFHSPGIVITASLLMGLLLGFGRLHGIPGHQRERPPELAQE